jgi:SPP1 family predicted phage head-tail adaptor
MYNKTIQLISETFIEDDIGQQISTPVYKKVYASEKSIGQKEFFLAGQSKIKPETCFLVRQVDYCGETKLRFPAIESGKVYSIYRIYNTKNELVELYCEVRAGNG